MNTAIFHSVNSGLYFWDGRDGLLIDGIHRGPETGCSSTPPSLRRQLEEGSGLFAHLTGLLFTHLHGDHFDPEGTARLLALRPELALYSPESRWGAVSPEAIPGGLRLTMGGIHIYARNTVHEGRAFQDTPHQSYLICLGGERFFVAGDGILTREDAAFFLAQGGGAEAGFLNPYQLLSPSCQEFLELFRPGRILLIHLPFPEDDRFRYWDLARQALGRLPSHLPPAELFPNMTWLDGRPAGWNVKGGPQL